MCRLNKISFLILLLSSLNVWANNITLSVLNKEIGENTITIQLQVTWENAWNIETSQINNDAAWLYIQAKDNNSNWKPRLATDIYSDDWNISSTETGYLITPRSILADRIASGILTLEVDKAEINNLYFGAIEMVYVSEGPFELGDSASINRISDLNGDVVTITSENALIKDDNITSTSPNSVVGDLPQDFPKGYDAFYCMKYEVSQAQFADFLNHISYNLQNKLLPIDPDSEKGTWALVDYAYFNGIKIAVSGNEANNIPAQFMCDYNDNLQEGDEDDGAELACNYLSWEQLLYYLDWVGLRPMTELEFEKACRGNQKAVKREFSFGTDNIVDANLMFEEFTTNETYGDTVPDGYGVGSHGYSGRKGPMRTGFAASETSNRLTSGASYWGIMELSGNLWEQVIGINHAQGLLFEGTQGNGDVSDGLAGDWYVTESNIYRGGAWNSGISLSFRDLAVSDRYYYTLNSTVARNTSGGRGVLSVKYLVK